MRVLVELVRKENLTRVRSRTHQETLDRELARVFALNNEAWGIAKLEWSDTALAEVSVTDRIRQCGRTDVKLPGGLYTTMNLDVLASPNTVEKRVEMVDARPAMLDISGAPMIWLPAGLNFLELSAGCGRRRRLRNLSDAGCTFRAPTAAVLNPSTAASTILNRHPRAKLTKE